MRTRTKRSLRARLDLLRLEDRTVPAVTASLVNGQLTVYGDGADNQIIFNQVNGQYVISGVAQTYAVSSVRAITIDGGDGNDFIQIGTSVTGKLLIFGGNGDDTINTGGGAEEIYGGMGNDTINAGGPGQYTIYGGYGNDTIAGAKNGDTVVQGSPTRTGQLGAVEQQIFALVNQQRALNGLPALAISPQLTYAAQLQSSNMAAMSTVVGLGAAMSHSLDGAPEPNLINRADYAGYEFSVLGENIAYGYSGATDVMNAWMNSPGHRANILQSMFTQIGISVVASPSGVLYFTQEFGNPAPGANNVGSSTTSTPIAPPPSNTTPTSAPTPPTFQPAQHLYAVGTKGGTAAQVVAYDSTTGRVVMSVQPFGACTMGVHVATGDLNGDGYDDLIVSAGAGGGPEVEVYDGKTGNLTRVFYAFDPHFLGGVNIATGDVDGDGKADIIVGAGAGGGPEVEAFSGADNHVLYAFYAYDPHFTGGVSVAAGDIKGNGYADIVTGAGAGGGPHVRAFDGKSLQEFRSFFAYDPRFNVGVNVAVGDVDGDGKADIITGPGAGGGPAVEVFSGADNHLENAFYAFSSSFRGGVSVATADVTGTGKLDLILGGGAGKTSEVKTVQADTLATVRDITVFDPSFLGGVFVG
jgi:uncharacterized protein YkwD